MATIRIRIGAVEITIDADGMVPGATVLGGPVALDCLGAPPAVELEHTPKPPKKVALKPAQPHVVAPNVNGAPLDGASLLAKALAFLREQGPRRIDAVARHLGCDTDAAAEVMDHDWFERENKLWKLSGEGSVEVNKDREA